MHWDFEMSQMSTLLIKIALICHKYISLPNILLNNKYVHFFPSFIHSLNKHFLFVSYVPGAIPGTKFIAVEDWDKNFYLYCVYILGQRNWHYIIK